MPHLDPDDRMLMRELQHRGLDVEVADWSDPSVDWAASRLCVLRSTWDYHERCDEFVAWVAAASELTRLQNEPALLRWNAHKAYLRDLEQCGVPIVPTAWVARGERLSLAQLAGNRGWSDVVLKPARGAAGHGVTLLRAQMLALDSAQARLDRLAETQAVLVQPYLSSVVTYGERALIFFERRYSHAVVKKPFDTVLAISDARSSLVEPTQQEIAVATAALEAVPGEPIYARVDLLRDERDIFVSEVELIEPALYLSVCESARGDFADAIERQLHATMEAKR